MECFRRTRGKWNADGNGKGSDGMSRSGVYQVPVWSVGGFFSLYTCSFSLFACLFSFQNNINHGNGELRLFEIQGLLLFSFFPSAFTALFPFDSCIYPYLFSSFSLKPVWGVKNVFACLFHISFLLGLFPFVTPFTHTKTPSIIISPTTNFLCHPLLFLHFPFPLQLTFTTIDMSVFPNLEGVRLTPGLCNGFG